MDFADSGKSKVELALDLEQLISQLCDQYSDLLRTGNDVAPEKFAEDYPDLAETLRPALAAVRVLVALGKQDLMPTVGSVLGDFRIVRLIARGGMGVVYEANQLSLGRKVAIKVLARLDSATASKAALIRFENEIRASASLDHANIVPIYGVERVGQFHFYAMRWIDGVDWSEWLRELQADCDQIESNRNERWSRDFRLIALAVRCVAAGLSHAHSRGVVHRDIKPSNLLRDQSGHVWIVDFGLAHFPSSTSLTATGELVGTLRYMSPEQVKSGPTRVDERSDIYSLGATFYQMLTGVPSVTAETPTEQLRQIVAGDFRKPSDIESQIPRSLETIVLKMMSFDAVDRYQSAQEIVDDLDRFLSQQPIRARLLTWQQRLVRWSRARAGVLLTVLSLLASVVLVLGVLVGQLFQTRRQLERQLVISHAAAAESYLTSRKQGQRYAALASLSLATEGMNSIEKDPRLARQLAKTAATALSLCDVEVDEHRHRAQGGSLDSVVFDRQLSRYTCYADGNLLICDIHTGHVQATLPLETEALTVCFSAQGDDLLILRGPEDHPTLELWRWPTQHLQWKHSCDVFSAVPKRFATDACVARALVAVGLDDGSIVVLDQTDGKVFKELKEPNRKSSAVGQIKFSNNGTWLAAAYVQDRKVVVWDIDSGQISTEFTFAEDTFAIAWSADDRNLALGSGYDIFLQGGPQWKVQLARLTGPREIIANLYYHPKNRWLVTYGYDGKTRVWDCHSESVRLEMDGHAHYFDYSGNKLGYRTYGDVGVWNFTFDDVVWHQTDRATAKFNPDATCFLQKDAWLAIGGADGCQIWDVERRSRVIELTGVDVSDLLWVAAKSHLLVATNKGLWRVGIEQLETAVAEGLTSQAFPWPRLAAQSLPLPEPATPLLIGASKDGRVIAASTDDGRVAVLFDQGPWRWLEAAQSSFRYLAVSEDGEFVAASERNAPRTTVWRVNTSNSWEIQSPEGGDVAFGINNNRTQLITSEQARYRVWELAIDGSPPVLRFDVLRPSGYQKSAVAFSPGLGWIVSLDRTTLQVIDPASGNPRLTLTDGYQTGRSICIRSNLQGTKLASVNGQEGFLVWNLELLRSNSSGLFDF